MKAIMSLSLPIALSRRIPAMLLIAAIAMASSSCSNPFAPKTDRPPVGGSTEPPAQATEPEIAMDNLERSFNERDKELYETLLDDGFWFTEENCLGDVVFENGKEEELEIMGPRDGSRQGIFDIFRTIEYEFIPIERWTELGRDFPIAFEGDPDGHPDEDWEVFRGRVQILLLTAPDEGSRVDQDMNFKLRQGEDGLWRIRRWVDDPLAGDCDVGSSDDETAKRIGNPDSLPWATLKQR